MPDDVVRARIDSDLKQQAVAVLDSMGLSVSDAIRLMLMRVVEEKAMPFQIRVPNAETQKAMKAVAEGDVMTFSTVKDLFDDLESDHE